MKGGKQPQGYGYTIVEVLIVLAVSGIMFVIAAQFINGKHEKATFTAGVTEMASRLQDTIEQVTNGQYSDVPINCSFAGGTTTFPPGSHVQGTNSQCVFLGKVLHFSERDDSRWPRAESGAHYETFLMAGGRADNTTLIPVTTPVAADAKVIQSLIKKQIVAQSLLTQKITVNGAATQSYGIGFFQGQGGLDANSNLVNGTAPVKMYYVRALARETDSTSAVGTTNNVSLNLIAARSVDIYLTDCQQSADITIGSSGNSQLTVNVKRNGFVVPSPCP